MKQKRLRCWKNIQTAAFVGMLICASADTTANLAGLMTCLAILGISSHKLKSHGV